MKKNALSALIFLFFITSCTTAPSGREPGQEAGADPMIVCRSGTAAAAGMNMKGLHFMIAVSPWSGKFRKVRHSVVIGAENNISVQIFSLCLENIRHDMAAGASSLIIMEKFSRALLHHYRNDCRNSLNEHRQVLSVGGDNALYLTFDCRDRCGNMTELAFLLLVRKSCVIGLGSFARDCSKKEIRTLLVRTAETIQICGRPVTEEMVRKYAGSISSGKEPLCSEECCR